MLVNWLCLWVLNVERLLKVLVSGLKSGIRLLTLLAQCGIPWRTVSTNLWRWLSLSLMSLKTPLDHWLKNSALMLISWLVCLTRSVTHCIRNQSKKLKTGGKSFGQWLMPQWMKVLWLWVLKAMTTVLKTRLKTLVLTRGVTSIVNVCHSLPAVWLTLVLSLVCLVTSVTVINGYLPVCHT